MPSTPADYFAIIGTGEELVWKNVNENDEVHRFRREIVQIDILQEDEVIEKNLPEEEPNCDGPPPASSSSQQFVVKSTLPVGRPGYEIVENSESDFPPYVTGQQLWATGEQWEANLTSLRDQLLELRKKGGLRAKVESTIMQWKGKTALPKFFITYRRRYDENTPAIADVQLFYARLPPSVVVHRDSKHSENSALVPLIDFLALPNGYEEWCIPKAFHSIRDPSSPSSPSVSRQTTVLFDSDAAGGVEAMASSTHLTTELPVVVEFPTPEDHYTYVPVLALRRQRLGEEERFCEDAAIIDIAVTIRDGRGEAVLPLDEDEDEQDEDLTLGKTPWSAMNSSQERTTPRPLKYLRNQLAMPAILTRKNVPAGFADAAFATKVLDRFPEQNYKGLPLPEEELPMFCYPTGCRLHRARFSEAPVAQYYGFVLKNERGDSIFVSCVSFMEPLTHEKQLQLGKLSERRRRTNLAHRRYCERREAKILDLKGGDATGNVSTEVDTSFMMMGFDDMTSFENKTICLISRYPYWTAFRKFLSHLHIISGASSDIPLERYISHLLLSVPLPKPGGNNVIVPLPALGQAMFMSMPPQKDFPLLDLSYHTLFSCLDIKTVIMIVLGMLALERKVIILSSKPSLVSDSCELLRSLLFPFELCAPYVPRLTEPFKSSLNFPGAIFVGIHDDGSPRGLASSVRNCIPEDSIVVDLDSGQIDCYDDRYETITSTWGSIPEKERKSLIRELQALCEDSELNDGQEPIDSIFDDAFEVTLDTAVTSTGISNHRKEPLDDRAVRDAFFRFFCSVLGGYERYLVVPDADFLTSGNDWFDTQGFLNSASKDRKPFLSLLTSTQMFQSFIQRRTEASDMHCMLFDECLAEFHSSSAPYGRLGADVEKNSSEDGNRIMFSLLVDQVATLTATEQNVMSSGRSFDASEAESSFNVSRSSAALNPPRFSDFAFNDSGDLITGPSRDSLVAGKVYLYCRDGNPCFPTELQKDLALPRQPESWQLGSARDNLSILTRSEKEIEEAERLRRSAVSSKSMNRQRRCLWQLPKIMGSQFLGSWLLCIPALVSTGDLSHDQQSRYLAYALGAIRILRGKHRIVPDEAAYRALMVACGRTGSDRRIELVRLFGLLRSDGIFPCAVTLGQYTKALADGYAKRLDDIADEGIVDVKSDPGLQRTNSTSPRLNVLRLSQKNKNDERFLSNLDSHLDTLEWHGKHWRQKDNERQQGSDAKRKTTKNWLPVSMSSSFVPPCTSTRTVQDLTLATTLIGMWSRTESCHRCGYIPLDEEIQAGWGLKLLDRSSIAGTIQCPMCTTPLLPKLGVKEFSLEDAKDMKEDSGDRYVDSTDDFNELPPQIRPTIDKDSEGSGISYVTYISPLSLRISLEQYVKEYGEEILIRDRLKFLDPEVFFNLFWYSARFDLPLPLPVVKYGEHELKNYCAFVAWDKSAAFRGCESATKVIHRLLDLENDTIHATWEEFEAFEEYPLLSQFNISGFYSNVWDHPDTSEILIQLVKACDKRDFKAVVETVIEINARRLKNDGTDSANEVDSIGELSASTHPSLDLYKTILYLSKYQCTSAFHNFFPTTLKACKGYHFWCAMGSPLPMFDRMLREGLQKALDSPDSSKVVQPHTVSDVALGFRCVFGHLI